MDGRAARVLDEVWAAVGGDSGRRRSVEVLGDHTLGSALAVSELAVGTVAAAAAAARKAMAKRVTPGPSPCSPITMATPHTQRTRRSCAPLAQMDWGPPPRYLLTLSPALMIPALISVALMSVALAVSRLRSRAVFMRRLGTGLSDVTSRSEVAQWESSSSRRAQSHG